MIAEFLTVSLLVLGALFTLLAAVGALRMPDAYELAHTSPPSATGLNPGDDLASKRFSMWHKYSQ